MKLTRLALAFWEMTGELATLRIVIDDSLQEVEAEISRLQSLPLDQRKDASLDLMALSSLKANLTTTRLALSYFRPLCHARIDECDPGIFARMAGELTGAFSRSEVRPEAREP